MVRPGEQEMLIVNFVPFCGSSQVPSLQRDVVFLTQDQPNRTKVFGLSVAQSSLMGGINGLTLLTDGHELESLEV